MGMHAVYEPKFRPLPLYESLAMTLAHVTQEATDGSEQAMHRLLLDLMEQHAREQLDVYDYATVLGTAVDVLFFFNYTPDMLVVETDLAYRASIIHQMGIAMLQTLAQLKPITTGQSFFREAARELTTPRAANDDMPQPLQCPHWMPLLAQRV